MYVLYVTKKAIKLNKWDYDIVKPYKTIIRRTSRRTVATSIKASYSYDALNTQCHEMVQCSTF